MYGVESCVHPEYQGQGVGSRLMDARFGTLKRLNLRGMVAGGMIMNYHEVAHELSAEQYVQEVIDGKRYDNNLTKQLHKGFVVHNLIPNYDYDPRACNWGVAIVWYNPDYRSHRRAAPIVKPGRYVVTPTPRAAAPTLYRTP